MLSFDGNGKWEKFTFKFGKEKLKRIFGESNIQSLIGKEDK